jgi:predicted SAM-dependent methyltransferase
MGRKLNIGGLSRSEGWEILNALSGPTIDHVQDARNLSNFPDATFEQIYASHIVEHFDYTGELLATLTEWCRVLVPGGLLCVSVPDLDVLARLVVDRKGLTAADRHLVMRMIFGGHVDRYDYHLVGLTDEFLYGYLVNAGFVGIQRVEHFGIFDDTSEVTVKGTPISLNMVARKPAAERDGSTRGIFSSWADLAGKVVGKIRYSVD